MSNVDDWKAKQAARAMVSAALQQNHPYLIPNKDKPACVIAAKNMRIELKRAFPSVKFTIRTQRYSGGDSINVDWIDGPTTQQVDRIIDKYSGGSFDGMTDCYNYESGAWTDAFGDSKYIFSNRKYSDKTLDTIIGRVCRSLGGLDTIPTAQDYHMGRLLSLVTSGGCDVNREVHQALSKHTFTIEAS